MKALKLVLPTIALGAATVFVAPAQVSEGFSTLGGSLGLTVRDFRFRNTFADATANDNTDKHASFPGSVGAEMAVWKAAVEWGSGLHGDGSGDPTQTLGDGGANFDFAWMGTPSGAGDLNDNIVSVIGSCSAGVLAFVQGGGSPSGWTMKFCDNGLTWDDGPGFAVGGRFDIQGVGTHEFGHSLGLGHSNVNAATMFPSTPNGNGQRSIAADDQAGVQFIYGAKSGSKPEITNVSIDGGLANITITGFNFSTSNNEVWFTNENITSTNPNPRLIVSGVNSTGGGTQIQIAIPAAAGSGDVLVRNNGTGFANLSNAYPADVDGELFAISMVGVFPSVIDRLIPGTDETILITGTGFDLGTQITLDGSPIATNFSLVNQFTLSFDMPDTNLGPHTIGVTNGVNSDSSPVTVVPNSTPALQCGTGDDGNPVFAAGFPVTFGGNPGEIHLLVGSTSAIPSVLPGKINLSLGNVFTQTTNLGANLIGVDGVTTIMASVVGLPGTTLYFQSLRIPLPFQFPLPESNREWVFQVD